MDIIPEEESLNEKEKTLLKIIREVVGFGEIRVFINDGKPTSVEELIKNIKL